MAAIFFQEGAITIQMRATAALPAWPTRHVRSYSVRWSRAKRRVIGNAGLEKIQLARQV